MERLVKDMTDEGFLPGLWFAPFTITDDCELAKKHPELLGDSYRQDKIVNLDVSEAKREFYAYLQDDVGLDSRHRKYKDGKLTYRLYFSSVDGTSNPAVLTVKGEAEATSLFSFLTGGITIPFEISSTNYRVD